MEPIYNKSLDSDLEPKLYQKNIKLEHNIWDSATRDLALTEIKQCQEIN
jgi:hypothetical protein